jgi:hypothetical protein
MYKLETHLVINEMENQYKVLHLSFHPNASSVNDQMKSESGQVINGFPVEHHVEYLIIKNKKDMINELNAVANTL